MDLTRHSNLQFLLSFPGSFKVSILLLISCLNPPPVTAQSRFSRPVQQGAVSYPRWVKSALLQETKKYPEEVETGEPIKANQDKGADSSVENTLIKALLVAEEAHVVLLFQCTSEEAFLGQLRAIPSTSVCWRVLPFQNPLNPDLPLRLTSPFGYRYHPLTKKWSLHKGLDFAAPAGSPVFAAGAGRVLAAGYDPLLGNYVRLAHGFGWSSVYGHLSAVAVQKGTLLHSTGLLGRSGTTGRSTGPHLHFGVYYRGKAVDGLRFLKLLQKKQP